MSEKTAEAKPGYKTGYKTTEFWLSLVTVTIGAVMASGIVPAESAWERALGLVVSGLAALGYTGARLAIKKQSF